MTLEIISKHCQLRELKTTEEEFPSQLDFSIRRICEKEGFVEFKIEKRRLSTNGGNYLGELYEINIKGRTNIGHKTLHLFVKHVIELVSLKVLSISNVYATELFAYNELYKIFTQLQEQANIPFEERYKMIHVYDESDKESLIMNNIAKRGFTTYYRMEMPPLKFFEMSVKQLAKFHGLSFVIRELKPEYFRTKIESLKIPFKFNDGWTEMVTSMKNGTIEYVDDESKDKLIKAYDNLLNKFSQYYSDDQLKVCLRHGDFRPCNMMIKMNEGDIEELIPVDYQLMHYGNPVFDFMYLIYSGTDRQFRKDNLHNLKELYYETLSSFFKYFDLDANVVYPRENFEKIYKEKFDFGFMSAMMLLPFVFASENDVPDFSHSEIRFQLDDKIKERLHEVLEEYTEMGYL